MDLGSGPKLDPRSTPNVTFEHLVLLPCCQSAESPASPMIASPWPTVLVTIVLSPVGPLGQPSRARVRCCGDPPPPSLDVQQRLLQQLPSTSASTGCIECEEALRLNQVERRRNVGLAIASSLAAASLYTYQRMNPLNPLVLLRQLEAQSPTLPSALASGRGTIVEFYAPWVCLHGPRTYHHCP